MFDGDDFKERVREATDIAAIIGQYVTLRKRGKNLVGLCPFHTEKTPSFTVHPDRQFYHCFGCGKGGDVFTFLMEHEGWSFPEALKYLAEKAGMPLPQRRKPEQADRYSRLMAANAAAAEFFSGMIGRPEGRHALEYITARGVQKSRLQDLGIGYAPAGWDGLIQYCARRSINEKNLIDAGLVVQKEETGAVYDRFRNRLTFAVCNLSGRPVGFGARALEKAERAKYINSPETPVYRKSHILYGLDKAREAIRRADCAVVVEGYTDWISLFQAEITNVVASSGTAFTSEQARLLARFSRNVVLLFDADAAGQKAALRGVEILFREGLEVKIAALPPGSDPDSTLRQNGEEYVQEAIHSAQGYVHYRIGQTRETLRSGGLLQQEAVIKELLSTAAAVDDRVRRALLVRQIADATGISEAELTRQLPTKTRQATVGSPPTRHAAPRSRHNLEAEFLRLLLERPAYIKNVKADVRVEDFRQAQLGQMYRDLTALARLPARLVPTDLGRTAEEKSAWAEIAALDIGPSITEEVLAAYVKKMVAGRPRTQTEELKRRIKEAEARGDTVEADRLLRTLQQKCLTNDEGGGKI